jgi:hypothetical protein
VDVHGVVLAQSRHGVKSGRRHEQGGGGQGPLAGRVGPDDSRAGTVGTSGRPS